MAATAAPVRRSRRYKPNKPVLPDTSIDIEDIVEVSDGHILNERETVSTTDPTDTSEYASPNKQPTRRVRKPARRIKTETGEVVTQAPSDWDEIYRTVFEMRTHGAAAGAAVDTMGCESLAQEEVSPREKRYHTLTALMLSSQTKDTVNAAAMKRLQTELPACKQGAAPGLNLENVLAVDPSVLNGLIHAVGFHNNKTRYIKATAEILRDRHAGDIPDSVEGLMDLPGVGPKMAYLCLSAAWGRTEGIGVDVHVHRITNLWGWHQTRTPEESRLALQAWLPRDKWHEINWLLVGLGQTVCLPVGRKCGECELGLRGLCKSAVRGKVNAGKRMAEKSIGIEVESDTQTAQVEIKVEEALVPVAADSDHHAQVPGVMTEEVLLKEDEKTIHQHVANAPSPTEAIPERERKRRKHRDVSHSLDSQKPVLAVGMI
jgi:endonuclease-3